MSNDRGRCARCRTSLAQDNRSDHCASCQPIVDQLRQHPPTVPPEFWSHPTIRDAAHRQHMGNLIAAYRRHPHHGVPISQEIVGHWSGMSQSQVSKLETRQPPQHVNQLAYWARLLGMPADLLWFSDPTTVSGSAVDGGDRTWDPATRAAPEAHREDAVDVLQRVHRLSRTIDPDVIGQLRALVHGTVADYEQLDHADLLPSLVKQRAWIATLIDEVGNPRQRRDLFGIGAGASGLLGYLAVGRSEFHLARAYCLEAFKLGELAEETNIQAWARGLQSICEYYARDYAEALRLAEDGLLYANAGPQSARLLTNGIARAKGKLGDVDGVHMAVDSAFALMPGSNIPDGLPSSISFGSYSQAQIASNAATAYLSLGMPGHVETYVDLAMPDIQRWGSPWSRSLVMIDQATALVSTKRGDLEQAGRLAIDAVSVSTGRPIVAVQQRAQEFVRHAARQWGDTAHLRAVREAVASELPSS